MAWVLTWLSCQQHARSRAGGTEQQLVAVIAFGILTGLDNIGACSLPILRTLMDYEAVK